MGDDRNDDVLISVDGELARRGEAKISVFDSGFVLGDGVWEGLRLHDGRIGFLDKHLDRLWAGAKMLRIDIGLSRAALSERLFDVIDAARFCRQNRPLGDFRRQFSTAAPSLRECFEVYLVR